MPKKNLLWSSKVSKGEKEISLATMRKLYELTTRAKVVPYDRFLPGRAIPSPNAILMEMLYEQENNQGKH